ncbi:GDP-mannose 4,6-dehydratase [Candidatus Latescibacterota bacterium]
MKNIKILITGCAGFIGSHLTEYFLDEGASVTGIDNLSRNGTNENLKMFADRNNFDFHHQDIRDFDAMAEIFKNRGPFDLVIHEAAQVAVTTSVTDPREDFEINALGTFNILEAVRLYSPEAFFEFASTNKVYGKMEDVETVQRNNRYEYMDAAFGIDEKYPLDFYSPYGCSKGAADQYVHDYSRIYGLRTVVLRQSCIYGTRQFGIEDQGWVAWFTIAAILGKDITIYGDGMQIRDILWIKDLVEIYAKLFAQADKVEGQVFNVGGGHENTLSLLELVDLLKSEDLLKKNVSFGDWRPGDQKVFVCNVNKAREVAGWEPTTSPQEGIRKLSAWVVLNKDLIQKVLG